MGRAGLAEPSAAGRTRSDAAAAFGAAGRRSLVKAALARVLAAWADTDTVVFGEVRTMRTMLETDKDSCAGPFVFTEAVEATLSDALTWRERVELSHRLAVAEGVDPPPPAKVKAVALQLATFRNSWAASV